MRQSRVEESPYQPRHLCDDEECHDLQERYVRRARDQVALREWNAGHKALFLLDGKGVPYTAGLLLKDE